MAKILTTAVSGLVTDDAAQPRAEDGRVLQLAEMPPGGDERLLRDLLAEMQIAAGAIGHGTGQVLIATHQSLEGTGIAFGRPQDQGGLIGSAGSRIRRKVSHVT
jgi:hypothetical protein